MALAALMIAAGGLAEPQVDGRTVLFGRYEQDNNPENGTEPIEWIVLKVEDGEAWLLSRYGLFPTSYHSTDTVVHWRGCRLRKKLNGDFLGKAFTAEEQDMIRLTTVTADRNIRFHTWAGKDCEDKVYLLSQKEVNEFFPEEEDRLALPTAYAVAKNCFVGENGTCGWWTRSPGHSEDDAARISSEGKYVNFQVNYRGDCVRPTIRVDAERACPELLGQE